MKWAGLKMHIYCFASYAAWEPIDPAALFSVYEGFSASCRLLDCKRAVFPPVRITLTMLVTKSILGLSLAVAGKAYAATTLFNGLQSAIFPTTTSAECLSSFNTSLQCDPLVSRLYTQTDWVGWNATNLTAFVPPDKED
jgi:hypothetical protein